MTRARYTSDDQSVIFPAVVPDGVYRSAIAAVLLADQSVDVALLTQQIVQFLDLYPESREIWVLAPGFAEAAVQSVRDSDDLSRRVATLGLVGLRTFLMDSTGRWSEHEPPTESTRGLVFADDLVDPILDVGGRAVFIGTASLLTAHSGYHFGKPSGSHSKYFLRAAGAVDRRMHAMVVAFRLIRRVDVEAVNRVWTDTAGISLVAAALSELRVGLVDSALPIVSDSFGGYDGLAADFDPRFGAGDVVLISSSTSGGLAARLNMVAPELRNILTLYGVTAKVRGDELWLKSVLFDLTASDERLDDATLSAFESSRADACSLCIDHHEATVALEGDGFFPATGGVTARKIEISDSSAALGDLMRMVAGRGVLRVRHLDGAKHPSRRVLTTRLGSIISAIGTDATLAEFDSRLRECVEPLVQPPTQGLVIAHLNDDDSAKVAQYILEMNSGVGRILSVDDPTFDQIVTASGTDHVLVIAAVIASGRSILNVSRRLRVLEPTTRTSYFAVVAHPESAYAFSQVTSTLTIRGTDPRSGELLRSAFKSGWVVYRDTLSDSDDSWVDEAQFLNELLGVPNSPYSEITSRLSVLRGHADAEDGKHLFLPAIDDAASEGFPQLARYFVFWDMRWQGSPSYEEVLYTVQCVLHNNRRSGKSGQYALVNDGGDRFVVEPHMFDRFNDPVLQASILRSARPGELDYSSDATFSRLIRGMVEFMVSRAASAEAGAVNEFLLSLCLGLGRGRTRHLRMTTTDLQLLAQLWRSEGALNSLSALGRALADHLIRKAGDA